MNKTTTSSVTNSKTAVRSDSEKFYGISWLDADAYCRNNSLGRLWGSDKTFLTKEGRLLVLALLLFKKKYIKKKTETIILFFLVCYKRTTFKYKYLITF